MKFTRACFTMMVAMTLSTSSFAATHNTKENKHEKKQERTLNNDDVHVGSLRSGTTTKTHTAAKDAGKKEEETERIIVRCKPGAEKLCLEEINDLIKSEGESKVKMVHTLDGTDFFSLKITKDEEENIMALDDVFDFEMDVVRHPLVHSRGEVISRRLAEQDPWGFDKVNAREMWNAYGNNRGSGVTVCVMDSGLEPHVDIDTSATTFDDLITEKDETNGGSLTDPDGHGTHVAGTIAATAGNGEGIVGVAPNVKLHIVRVFNDNGVWYGGDVAAAAVKCEEGGADVINMSLGGGGVSEVEISTFNRLYAEKGIISVAAAGNSGNGNIEYPAAIGSVISVAAIKQNENLAGFSTRNQFVELAAPGVNVLSLANDGESYVAFQGTSMASPHVAGVAALLKGAYPSATAEEIRHAMRITAKDKSTAGRDALYGFGIVNAKAAADYLGTSCSNNEEKVVVRLVTDGYAEETSWAITNSNEQTVFESTGLANSESTMVSKCIPKNACYTFAIGDAYGDGICCSYGNGRVEVFYGSSLEFEGAEYGGGATSGEFGGGCGGGGDDGGDDEGGDDNGLKTLTLEFVGGSNAFAERTRFWMRDQDTKEKFWNDKRMQDGEVISESIELDPAGCYLFLARNNAGNGSDKLVLTWDGVKISNNPNWTNRHRKKFGDGC
mmetsp:Transcript_19921/g.56414  ORF Transcript_19921/g.56414 Transcript_19921/m.56414 type:complete len:668 (+) Transcript_19921:90-2093(+)